MSGHGGARRDTLRTVPGVTQRSQALSTLLLPGPTAGNFFAYFTTDLSEP